MLAAPDFTFAVGPSPARSLRSCAGQRTVLLVLFSLPYAAPRMRQLAEVYGEAAIPRPVDHRGADERGPLHPGAVAAILPSSTPSDPDGWRPTSARVCASGAPSPPAGLRPEPPAPAHMELVIDRQGYIRARWIPGEGRASWSDLTILRDEIQILASEVTALPPDEHVH